MDVITVDASTLLRALEEHPADLCRRHHIERYTLLRIVRAYPTVAVAATKYDGQPRNREVAERLGMSVQTVRRARRVLRQLFLLAEVAA